MHLMTSGKAEPDAGNRPLTKQDLAEFEQRLAKRLQSLAVPMWLDLAGFERRFTTTLIIGQIFQVIAIVALVKLL
jgi:hypothetical protein